MNLSWQGVSMAQKHRNTETLAAEKQIDHTDRWGQDTTRTQHCDQKHLLVFKVYNQVGRTQGPQFPSAVAYTVQTGNAQFCLQVPRVEGCHNRTRRLIPTVL